MALELDIQTTQFGVPFSGAYFRVVSASIMRQRLLEHKFIVVIDVTAYGTSTPTEATHPVDFRRYHAPLEEIEAQVGTEFLAKCYNWVANQPDMAGSTPA